MTSTHGTSFPGTRWSLVLGGGQANRQDLERLARGYWRPIAAYVRALRRCSTEEAADTTQDFFLWMLESDFLGRADPRRGRFRGFVKTALRHYVRDEERRRRATKRGGGHVFISLDASETTPVLALPDTTTTDPETLLDELWRAELIARALDRLEHELRAEGRDVAFELFNAFFVSDEDTDYATLAERHGLSKAVVSNALQRVKARYRAALRQLVLETVNGPEALAEEFGWLFGRDGKP